MTRRGSPALAVALLAGTAAALMAAPTAARVKAGVFLYATPDRVGPPFTETVVLLLQHGPDGSMGLVVNRPTRVPLREAVKDLTDVRDLDLRLHWGGPVQPDVVLALVRSAKGLSGAERVMADVQFTSDPKQWKRVAAEPEAASRLRVYRGYAGWAPGQLAQEMRGDAWVVAPADARSVFSSDPEELWPRVHDLRKRIEARFDYWLMPRAAIGQTASTRSPRSP
jgi:putative transcriptional regulator